jgi:hypothetical protein
MMFTLLKRRLFEKKNQYIIFISVFDFVVSGSVSMPDQSLTMAEALSDEPDLSTFENKSGLADDMKFLASMPELCDVTFLVGDTREPVCAVKAVLAARSR